MGVVFVYTKYGVQIQAPPNEAVLCKLLSHDICSSNKNFASKTDQTTTSPPSTSTGSHSLPASA